MRFAAYYAYQRHAGIKNIALPVIIFVTLSAALLGPLLLSPSRSIAHGELTMRPMDDAIAGTLQSYVLLANAEQSSILKQVNNSTSKASEIKRKLMLDFEGDKEKMEEKVDHAKVANVVSLSASAAILLGAFTARRVAKRRLEVGESFFESDSNVGRISDDIAYDLAYTTKSEISYGSFAAPWTGDLEKFDV